MADLEWEDMDDESKEVILTIENGLARYYKKKFADYNGTFKQWCVGSGYGKEDIEEEIENGDPDACTFLDFDDAFPCSVRVKNDDTQRNVEIFRIIKCCLEDPNAFMEDKLDNELNDLTQPEKDPSDQKIAEEHKESKKKDKEEINHDDDEKQKEITRDTIERNNALVLCLAISQYDKPLHCLPDTTTDVSTYKSSFEGNYKYKLITNAKQRMSKDEVDKFFRSGRNILYDYEHFKLNYDSLIVTYGGHGTHDKIICSDGSKYEYIKMREIFNSEPKFKHIPKIFLIDACRTDNGDEKEETTNAREGGATVQTFSTTLMQSEGHSVRGGQICRFITEQLDENFENNNFTDFRSVYKEAKKRILADTNEKQTINLNEHDTDVEDIKLLPRIWSRGTGEKRLDVDARQTSPPEHDPLRNLLDSVEMIEYYEKFKQNDLFSVEALKSVDEQKLKDLGVADADCSKLLNACKAI